MEGKEKTNHINNCIKHKYKWSKQLKGRDSQTGETLSWRNTQQWLRRMQWIYLCASTWTMPKAVWQVQVLAAQSCPTLCNPVDCSPPGSSVHGILQAKIMVRVAISFPRDLPHPGVEPTYPALQVDSLPLSHQGSRVFIFFFLFIHQAYQAWQ